MPEWVTPHSEPVSKLALFASMVTRLRGSIKAGASPLRIQKAAERVRLAQLSVIKAKLALIREYPQRDPGGRQSESLRTEERRWQTLTTETIIEQYRRSEA